MIKVIHSWPRVCGLPALTINEDPLYCQAPYPFSYSISHPTPTYPCPPIDKKKIYFHCSFCFLISLTEWMIVTHLMFLLEIIDLHMSSLGTLLPEKPCMLYTTRYQIYWGLTHNEGFCWYSDLISHTHKQ